MGKLTFTRAGIASLVDAKSRGFQRKITHVAIGDKTYTPSKEQTALRNEVDRVAVEPISEEELENIPDGEIPVMGIFDNEKSYAVGEVGCFLDNGVLLAVNSEEGSPQAYKSRFARIVQDLAVGLAALPEGSLTVVVGGNLRLSVKKELVELSGAMIDTMHRQLNQELEIIEMKKRLEGHRV